MVGNATALQLQPIFEKENNKPFHWCLSFWFNYAKASCYFDFVILMIISSWYKSGYIMFIKN